MEERKPYMTRSAVKSSDQCTDELDLMLTPIATRAGASSAAPPVSELPAATPATVETVRGPRSTCSDSSRVSRAGREARRMRAEYDAEVELTRMRESVIQKKLAMEMAMLAAEEAEEELQDERSVVCGPPGRVGQWLRESAAAALPGHTAPPAPPPPAPAPASQPSNDIQQLAQAIAQLRRTTSCELPSYNGSPADWLGFAKAYRSTMEGYRPFENMARLRVALAGDAKEAVSDLLCTASDPQIVFQALEEEFGHPTRLLECAMRRIRELPNVSESGSELRSFTNIVRNCWSVLNSVSADGYINNPQIVREVLSKLTTNQRIQYGEFAMRKEIGSGIDLRISPRLDIVIEFLRQITRVTSYYNTLSDALNPLTAAPTTTNARQKDTSVHRVHTQVEYRDDNNNNSAVVCGMCAGGHKLYECEHFGQLTVEQRWDFVKTNRLCFKCIVKNHAHRFCRAKRCGQCQSAHHDMLHTDSGRNETLTVAPAPPPPTTVLSSPRVTTAHITAVAAPQLYETVTNLGQFHARALLKVIPITLVTSFGEERPTYALLDDGASVSLLEDGFASGIDGPVTPLRLLTAGGQCVSDSTSRSVRVVIRGPNGVSHDIGVHTMRNVDLPAQTVPAAVLDDNPHLRTLHCSEMRDAKPMLLLGQDNWKLIVGREIRQGKSGRPVASLTLLGWVVHGPLSLGAVRRGNSVGSFVAATAYCMSTSSRTDDDNVHDLVKAQFELEAIGISEVPRKHDMSDRAVGILDSTSRRVPGGWEVGLLWNSSDVQLPDDYEYACRRLAGIERKMGRSSEYAAAYTKQIDRLVSENYARKLDHGIQASPVWYLPHFGVTNVNKPGKLRLVFDAAARYQGTSLNENLLSGPDLLNSLMGVLIKFRMRKIAFTADIADMFMRVKIREADQGAQLFLWRDPRRPRAAGKVNDPDIYAMNVMIFGATSSPTSAIYILNKNAEEFIDTYPAAVDAIKRKHYVDDYLDSTDTVEAAQQLISDVTQIHRAGGFDIRGWVTSSLELREQLPSVVPGRVKLDRSESERTLGMIWCPETDCMKFDLSFKRLPKDLVEGSVTPTKREFLKFIMSIFDPLGLVYPCVIQSRVLMQSVWQSGISWDDKIKDAEAVTWFEWLDKLRRALASVSIPRWYGLELTLVDLHVFGDASEKAYAAVAYLVGTDGFGNRICTMVTGKARVAPVKVVSIPRLELQAAVLASRLAVTVKTELDVKVSNEFLWSDSMTVLRWINSNARDYQKYVSFRLAEIDRITKRSDWHWVPSESNPADEATRLDWPDNKGMWLSGPPFLCDPQVAWPSGYDTEHAAQEPDPERVERALVTIKETPPLIDVTRFSSWMRAVRVTAHVMAFVGACRAKQRVVLTRDKLQEAEAFLLREAQARAFRPELDALRAGQALSKSSRLLPLDPMLFEDGLLRVKGRLGASTELSFEEKHPIILDGKCPTTRLLVLHHHVRALHANHETVVNCLRARFWVTHIRPTVKAVVARCQYCRLLCARPSPPKMADLPPVRLNTTRRGFVNCGVDYFGPMEVTIGRRREKRWGVLFTCLSTRAIHLELAASLSADSAILALRRLVARRGCPAVILSDCGTNFVGANNELRVALRALDRDVLCDAALARGIDWRFNPPGAPHMGGCWERLVRSVKSALRVTLRERAPREEVLHTLLLEAEMVINSRPLAYVSSDPAEPTVLTPNHLLLGTATGDACYVPYDPKDVDARRQWKKVNALAEAFWRRWKREYLPTLQRRQKWMDMVDSVKVGDVVLVSDTNQPRNVWPRGRVIKVCAGSGGVVRVVEIKTASGTLRRPVTRIVVLPTDGSFIG